MGELGRVETAGVNIGGLVGVLRRRGVPSWKARRGVGAGGAGSLGVNHGVGALGGSMGGVADALRERGVRL